MGQHKHNNTPPLEDVAKVFAVVSDLEDVAKVLAEEKLFCEQCGVELALWPPDDLREHTMTLHEATVWPAIAEAWRLYKADTDLARRTNFRNQMRVQFFFAMLQHRRDLYDKLVEAGVIRSPKQG